MMDDEIAALEGRRDKTRARKQGMMQKREIKKAFAERKPNSFYTW